MKLESQTLKKELENLEQMTGVKTGCKIIWTPETESKKEGEVLDKTIYIYSLDLAQAIHTLRHEFFDMIICETNKPYVEIINTLLSVISEKAYQKKEDVVEVLVRLARCFNSISAKDNLAVA